MPPDEVQGSSAGSGLAEVLRSIYYVPAFYFCLAIFGLSCLAWSLPAAILHRLLPARRGERLGQFMIMAGFRWFVGVMRVTRVLRTDFAELDRLHGEGALVIAPNHPTMLDAVLLISRLPHVVCITKASLWDNTFLGGGIRMAAYIRNDAPRTMIRQAAAAVAEGRQLMIFPEGSRTAERPVSAFHRSFAVIARAAEAPVQTVFIEADSPYLSKGWPLFRRPVLPLVFRFRLGRRFEVSEHPEAFTRALEAYFRDELRHRPRPAA